MDFVNSFHPKKITGRMVFSGFLFLLFMSLDFYMTEFVAQGDTSMEGNVIAAWWWNIFGPYRHIDIPIWIIYILGIAYILNMKREFLALWWLNGIAFGHMLGWISWLPTRAFDFLLYPPIKNAWLLNLMPSIIGLFLGMMLALFQIKFFIKKIKNL